MRMDTEPRSLGLPLDKREWKTLLMVAICAFCAWLWYRPTEPVAVLVSLLIGGPAFWVGLGPGLSSLKSHRLRALSILAQIGAVLFVYVVMRWVVPWTTSYLQAHA